MNKRDKKESQKEIKTSWTAGKLHGEVIIYLKGKTRL